MVKMIVNMVKPFELKNLDKLTVGLGDGEVNSAEEIGQAILSLREQMAGPDCMFHCDAFIMTIQFGSDDVILRARIGDKVEPNAGVYDPASDEAMESARQTGHQIPKNTTFKGSACGYDSTRPKEGIPEMKTYAVVFYDGNERRVKKMKTGIPESTSYADWGLTSSDEIIMVVGPLEDSALAYIEGEALELIDDGKFE